MIDYQGLFEDYCTVTAEDDDEMRRVKHAVSALNEVDRRIWVLFCEIGTYSGLARLLQNSPPTAKKKVCEIRGKIMEYKDV